MKYLKYLFVSAVFCLLNSPVTNAQSIKLASDIDSVSFFLGYYFGKQLESTGVDIKVDIMSNGLNDAIARKSTGISDEEISQFMNKYFIDLQAKVNAKNLKEGQDFLAANAKKQGVVTLPSGLQYKIIREGTGNKPEIDDYAELIYHGSLIDGTVFDSSKERGDTVTFQPGSVIPGFAEALTLMSEGAIWEIYIPAELGYGEHVNPSGPIKPNSVLIFEIDLVRTITEEEYFNNYYVDDYADEFWEEAEDY